ncbi:unnamed protein product [Effrenium voratum]|uniref:Protein kinase domain-containing protein n=1 Tax=Effrenium voratum TaxID=2562239 RepID=A0AA36MYK0_9DINO|nr:unnamed protein product [Effrenium voratum]CAJ1438999.1 unnamed protein product [Effrenium voratum]
MEPGVFRGPRRRLVSQPAQQTERPPPLPEPAASTSLGRSEFLQFLGASTTLAFFAAQQPRFARARTGAPSDPELLPNSLSCGGLTLKNPKYIGGGVQAEVYSASVPGTGLVALKLSRTNDDYAQGTFAREKQIMKLLQDNKVPNVVRCLGSGQVSTRDGPRCGLVLSPCTPFARNISVKTGCGLPQATEAQEAYRMEQLMGTAVRVLESGVAGVDVQVLQPQGAPDLTWIDFTEAALLKSEKGKLAVEGPAIICPEYEKRYRSAKDAVIGYATALTEELQTLAKERKRGVGKTFQDVWAKLPWRCSSFAQQRLEYYASAASGDWAAV